MREKPSELDVNLFDLKAEQIEELVRWFEQLAGASEQHVARVWEISARQRK